MSETRDVAVQAHTHNNACRHVATQIRSRYDLTPSCLILACVAHCGTNTDKYGEDFLLVAEWGEAEFRAAAVSHVPTLPASDYGRSQRTG